jgi:ribosome biogenesis GTPase / thiamine phosphate phosphatase
LKERFFRMPFHGFSYRVVEDRGATFGVMMPDGQVARFTCGDAERPVVGDHVLVDEPRRRIVGIVPRSSWIARVRSDGSPQYVAANVTTGLIVTSPETREFSPRRVARYLVALRAGRVDPVIVVNKCDLGVEASQYVGAFRVVAAEAPVVPVSARDGTNCDALEQYLRGGATLALCGSSGVGKSTLLNRLLGRDAMATHRARADGRGRHTTTFRRLFVFGNGVGIIDTPGMRAFCAWASSTDVDDAFGDVTALAARCRFVDCTHSLEPGCAVLGGAEPERLEQWRKLRREAEWLASRENPALAAQRKRRWKNIHKEARRALRLKRRR